MPAHTTKGKPDVKEIVGANVRALINVNGQMITTTCQ